MEQDYIRASDFKLSGSILKVRLSSKPELLTLKCQRSKEITRLPFKVVGKDIVEIDLNHLGQLLPAAVKRYDFFAVVQGRETPLPIFFPKYQAVPIWQRYFRTDDISILRAPHIYINRKGFLGVIIRNPIVVDNTEKMFRYDHNLTKVSFSASELILKYKISIDEPGKFKILGSFLRLNTDTKDVRISSKKTTSNSGRRLTGTSLFKFSSELEPIRYTLFVILEHTKSHQRVHLKINHLSETLYSDLHLGTVAPTAQLSKKQILGLSTNSHTTLTSFLVREITEYDKSEFLQTTSAFVARTEAKLLRSIKHRHNKPTAIIFEKQAATAQDNGFAFFKYLVNLKSKGTHIPFDFYYVLDKNSPQKNRTDNLPNVLSKYSFKLWRLLATPGTFTVSSDTRFHLALQYAQPDLLNKFLYMRRNVFLQHGVFGLKKTGILSQRHAMCPDVVVASSDWEKDIITDAMGYPSSQVEIVGLSRWDNLPKQNQGTSIVRNILYMPTWRNWLEGADAKQLTDSDFFKTIKKFLNSNELHKFLTDFDINLHFVPHPLMRDSLTTMDFESDRIHFVNQNGITFQKLLEDNDMLISDYSSIVWDFVQMNKPVVLYQFDLGRYSREVGIYEHSAFQKILSHIPRTKSLGGLMKTLTSLTSLSPADRLLKSRNLRNMAFKLSDTHNAKRTLEAITRRLPELRKTRNMPEYAWSDKAYSERMKEIASAHRTQKRK